MCVMVAIIVLHYFSVCDDCVVYEADNADNDYVHTLLTVTKIIMYAVVIITHTKLCFIILSRHHFFLSSSSTTIHC